MKILEQLKLPEIKQIDNLDDVRTTLLHGELLQRKGFLRKVYHDFYQQIKLTIEKHAKEQGAIVELGSGGGFFKDVIPQVITSDVLEIPTVDLVFSATQMPFEKGAVDSFTMIDVLHHIPDVTKFFQEADRCLKPGGVVVMIEPANTLWGRFVYQHFHHETFDPNTNWTFESKGPLSTANGALPWIVFHRDRQKFIQDFPNISIIETRFHTPMRYLISGGFSIRQLMPTWTYPMVHGLELLLQPFNQWLGMFETIVLQKKESG